MDHFAAAFQVANDSRPTMEDERTADPFSMFCETPGSPSESRFFELSPPDSNGPDFSFDHDVSFRAMSGHMMLIINTGVCR